MGWLQNLSEMGERAPLCHAPLGVGLRLKDSEASGVVSCAPAPVMGIEENLGNERIVREIILKEI